MSVLQRTTLFALTLGVTAACGDQVTLQTGAGGSGGVQGVGGVGGEASNAQGGQGGAQCSQTPDDLVLDLVKDGTPMLECMPPAIVEASFSGTVVESTASRIAVDECLDPSCTSTATWEVLVSKGGVAIPVGTFVEVAYRHSDTPDPNTYGCVATVSIRNLSTLGGMANPNLSEDEALWLFASTGGGAAPVELDFPPSCETTAGILHDIELPDQTRVPPGQTMSTTLALPTAAAFDVTNVLLYGSGHWLAQSFTIARSQP